MRDDYGVQLAMEDSRWGILAAREEIWNQYAFAILADGENGEEQVVGHMVASKLSVGELYRQRLPLWMAFDDHSRKIGEGPHFFFVVDQFLERRRELAEEEGAWT